MNLELIKKGGAVSALNQCWDNHCRQIASKADMLVQLTPPENPELREKLILAINTALGALHLIQGEIEKVNEEYDKLVKQR